MGQRSFAPKLKETPLLGAGVQALRPLDGSIPELTSSCLQGDESMATGI